MQRYRRTPWWLPCLGMLLAAGGCSIPSAQENAAEAAQLVAAQVDATLPWRRDPEAEAAANTQIEALLADGLRLHEAIQVAYLASPDLQVAMEQLEISRSAFVAAATPPNPLVVIGVREAGGNLAAFYPDKSISFGVLQNVIALLNMPDRRAIARRDLTRARYETAHRAVTRAAEVTQAFIEYDAAQQIFQRREGMRDLARSAHDERAAAAPGDDAQQGLLTQQLGALVEEESELIRARLEAQKARHRLGELLGIAGRHDQWRIVAGMPLAMPETDPQAAQLELIALQGRFDLQAAVATVEARLRVLATQRRFRWLNQAEIGLFREKAIGGTAFTGPNIVFELPVFDQRQATLLAADAELNAAMRRLEAQQIAARTQIRRLSEELATSRALVRHFETQLLPYRQATAGASDVQAQRAFRTLHNEAERLALMREYWKARIGLALASGDWREQSGLL